jgi:valyl-tRNA synthetase
MHKKASDPSGMEHEPSHQTGGEAPREPLPKAYEARFTEDRIYAMWEKSGAFRADNKSNKEPFTISMPPPNATGQLHLGHAVMLALEDIFIRFARMQGKEALWVPGTDHAAIATESVVIKKIQKEEKMKDPRATLGREKLLTRIAEFVESSRGTIRSQVRKMGSSCDWSRERYTMDPTLNRCVNEVFVKMYKDGLIYRGHRIVNWDPKLQTTVSDDEIEYEERTEPFYTFQYGPFQISTSRPETKFGDKYVVMHPDDERYAQYKHGDQFEAEWINGPVRATIIKDKAVDPTFGTGVMTITPWHDAIDFEIAERHDLQKVQVIDFEGKLLSIAGEFAGMPIEDARPLIVEKLKSKGLVVSVKEDNVHNVSLSQRGKGKIEPQIKEQWFIDVNKKVVSWKRKKMSLKEVMQEVVHTGLIKIIPERFEKTYFHWIDNLRDWCISRQIWWGHRVPVWYREDKGGVEIHVGTQPPVGSEWRQDPDTLDTWFSSAMWTWSTLIDSELAKDFSVPFEELLLDSPDFMKFHPTHVMETGYDILFFWVSRMILMTTYVTGSLKELEYGHVPFDTVYLHGLIRTRDGRKMSKSDPDTMIDPLDMISKYGADALRLSMIVGQSPGNDSRLYEEKIAGYRNFVNKLWNASRFILMQCEQASENPQEVIHFEARTLADKALIHALEKLVADVTDGLEQYRLSEVGDKLYSFVWDYFCDWYLELSKGEANIGVLIHALRTILTLLHPYCPFVTEELWSKVKAKDASDLIRTAWPIVNASSDYAQSYEDLQMIIEVITAIRKLRTDQSVEPKKEVDIIVVSKEYSDVLESQQDRIRMLGKVRSLTVQTKPGKYTDVASAFLKGIEVHLSLKGLIDKDKEKASLQKEKEQLQKFLKGIQGKLHNESFVAHAPTKVLEMEREKEKTTVEKLKKIEERLNTLK